MQLNKKRKTSGTIEMIVAALIIISAIITAPNLPSQVNTVPQTTEAVTEATTSEVESTTAEAVSITEAPETLTAAMEYTITNYIIVTSNAAMEMYSISKTRLQEYANVINTFATKVPDKNVYVMLAPTRIAFYGPQEYRTGSHSQPDGINLAYSALSPSVTAIDAYSSLARHKYEYVFFRTDHHWTARGAYYAYTAFCDKIGDTYVPIEEYEVGVNLDFVGSMYRYTQSENLLNDPDYVEYYMPLNNATGQFFSNASMSDGKELRIISPNIKDRSSKYMTFIQGDKPLIKMTTTNPSGRKILVIKESYGNAFAPFLCENYSEVYVLDPRQDGVSDMNLTQFVNDNGINDIMFINYIMAPSNSKYMTALSNIVSK